MSTISTYIRDQAYQRLTTGVIAAQWSSTRKVPLPTVQDDDLPCLSVFLLREEMTPDGDPTAGVPKYVANAVLGISVVDVADKPETIDGALDSMVDLIEDTLLQDQSFITLKDTDGNPVIEGFPSIRRTFSFPQQGESYYIEARIELTVQYRCYFTPVATNPLTDVEVNAQPFDGSVQSGEYVADIQLPQS